MIIGSVRIITSMKLIASGLVIVCCLFSVLVAPLHNTSAQQANSEVPKVPLLLHIAPDCLHKAAVQNHGQIVVDDDARGIFRINSLDNLTRQSKVILVGTVQSSRGDLVQKGSYIDTRYEIRVEKVLKGPVTIGQIFEISLQGGTFTFEDGTVATVLRSVQPALLQGHRYVLFCRPTVSGKYFFPTGGDRGVFEFGTDGHSVHPHADPSETWNSMLALRKLNQNQFLTTVATVVSAQN